MSDIVLLDRFFRKIHTHLVSCYGEVPHWPVLLGIFGRPGDGKSVQIDAALQQCNVEIIRVNAADLESGLAGEPGKYVARTYATASLAVAKQIPTALVIDDIDTTVGEWEMNTGTVNHQQVLAELMHLADKPVDQDRGFPRRVPVFVTGNNLARLYPPLRRHGRMNTFNWQPMPSEIYIVAQGIFGGMADDRAVAAFVGQFSDEPLSFLALVRQEILNEEAAIAVSQVGNDMRSFLRHGHGRPVNGMARRLSADDLLSAAQRVQSERKSALTNFLAYQASDAETR
jgi:hypothetical protein